jgi:phosphatidate cytidylyltransferase
MASNMTKRVGVAAVAIPAAFGMIYLGGWALTALISVFGALGALELLGFFEEKGGKSLKVPTVIGALSIPVGVYLVVSGAVGFDWILVGFPVWVIVVSAFALSRGPTTQPLTAVSTALFAAAYPAGLSSAIIILRELPETSSALAATWLVLLPMVLTWVCDSFAMSFGGMIGGKKFAPVVSPNKTWSGAISGALGAVLLAPLYDLLILDRFGIDLPLGLLLTVGLVVGALGQMGDLAESLFKREAGIKDSGTFFPGHGGILDRLDSLYWVLPSTIIVFKLFEVI